MARIIKLLGGLAIALTATGASAQTYDLQGMMVQKCAEEITHFKVADAATAKKLCTCTTKAQADTLTLGEYWQMQSHALNGKNPKNLPAAKRLAPKIEQCRSGLKLNQPQVPDK